jgi:hypothetical protein
LWFNLLFFVIFSDERLQFKPAAAAATDASATSVIGELTPIKTKEDEECHL